MSGDQVSITFRYLTRFRCVGTECEDTCCGDWRVHVDDATHARLTSLWQGEGRDPGLLFLPVVGKDGATQNLMRRIGGQCVMLDAERLCTLHKHHGEELLPDVCAVFPRQANHVLDELEVTATAGCPEIARGLLLADDALEVEALSPSLMARASVTSRIRADESDPYRQHFLRVREVMLELLDLSAQPLDCRLFLIAYLAASIHPFYTSTGQLPVPAGDAAPAEFPFDELRRQLGIILHGEAQEHLARRFAEVERTPDVGRLVLEVLKVLTIGASPRLEALVARALAGCEATDGEIALRLEGRELRISSERFYRIHGERRSRLSPTDAARLESCTARYLKNLVVHCWFITSNDLFIHQQALHVRLAVLRFLVLGQATTDQPPGGDEAARAAAFDADIVAVFSSVTRAFDHSTLLSPMLTEALMSMGTSSTLHAAWLLKF